jgi:hypothetical protein
MARIENVVDEETQIVRLENAVLQQKNVAFEHIANRAEWSDGVVKSFDHFFMHIPKMGGIYAVDVLPKILQKSPQRNRLLPCPI